MSEKTEITFMQTRLIRRRAEEAKREAEARQAQRRARSRSHGIER